jgi:hypothetical protein
MHRICIRGLSGCGLPGVVYKLKQFHVHTISEHTVDGEHYDMEMHFVHTTDDYTAFNKVFPAYLSNPTKYLADGQLVPRELSLHCSAKWVFRIWFHFLNAFLFTW